MAQAPQNVWNNSWGSQTNRESTPPAGWTWDFGKNYWEYTGVIPTTPAAPTNTAIYQTSSVDCFPDVVVNTSGDPITFPTGKLLLGPTNNSNQAKYPKLIIKA